MHFFNHVSGFTAEEISEKPRKHVGRSIHPNPLEKDGIVDKPNELSEDLMKCLMEIFLELNRPLKDDREGPNAAPKLALACMNSRSFTEKTSLDNANSENLDPYRVLSDLDSTNFRDIGPYKNFIQITRGSLEISRFPECLPTIRKLRSAPAETPDYNLFGEILDFAPADVLVFAGFCCRNCAVWISHS